jgi:hypothetical protein
MTLRKLTLFALLAPSLLSAAPAHAAKRSERVPQGFVGMMADGPVLQPPVDLDSQLGDMVHAGVESLRAVFDWHDAQPYATFADVPAEQRSRFRDVSGVPTDFSAIDRVVRAATLRRLALLPVVLVAPDWDARHPGEFASPPRDAAPYARFVAALASRYGPRGSFWRENPALPRLPVRDWQLWNEPSFTQFWSDQPFVADYVALLRASRKALKAVDPGARVVLAGFTSRSWVSLARLYKAGARRLFDVVAVHPFSLEVNGVLRILHQDRVVMKHNHDAKKPMWVTETSWPSALGKTSVKFGYEVSERGQAAKAREALIKLAAARRVLRLGRVYWYTWMSPDTGTTYPFDYSGLRKPGGSGVVSKPALGAFRTTALRLEHCRAKASVATRCLRH